MSSGGIRGYGDYGAPAMPPANWCEHYHLEGTRSILEWCGLKEVTREDLAARGAPRDDGYLREKESHE